MKTILSALAFAAALGLAGNVAAQDAMATPMAGDAMAAEPMAGSAMAADPMAMTAAEMLTACLEKAGVGPTR